MCEHQQHVAVALCLVTCTLMESDRRLWLNVHELQHHAVAARQVFNRKATNYNDGLLALHESLLDP